MRRARALVEQGRAAARAKAARRFGRDILEAGDAACAFGETKTLAPAADIGRIGRAMRAPACFRVVVPGPARGIVDLEAHRAAQTAAGDRFCGGNPLALRQWRLDLLQQTHLL